LMGHMISIFDDIFSFLKVPVQFKNV
jgi:hypothetical protein